jgi:hypothetical protein
MDALESLDCASLVRDYSSLSMESKENVNNLLKPSITMGRDYDGIKKGDGGLLTTIPNVLHQPRRPLARSMSTEERQAFIEGLAEMIMQTGLEGGSGRVRKEGGRGTLKAVAGGVIVGAVATFAALAFL